LSVSGSGSSASVSAKSPGRTTVRVEHETKDGETIEAEKSGSVVELLSVSAVPQIALTDENDNELPSTLVSLVQDPPDGDLLPFAVADPAIATVFNTGSVLQIQGLREGNTTAQAKTLCDVMTGPVIKLEVIRCDKKKIDELTEALKEAEQKLDQNRKRQDETARDSESG
jgi:hypothetical protein